MGSGPAVVACFSLTLSDRRSSCFECSARWFSAWRNLDSLRGLYIELTGLLTLRIAVQIRENSLKQMEGEMAKLANISEAKVDK